MVDWQDVVKVSELLLFVDYIGKVFGGASSLMMARMVMIMILQ